MEEFNNKCDDMDMEDEADCDIEDKDSPFDRILEEKRCLDEKIIKLVAFLQDERARQICGWEQVDLMEKQLQIMIEYSSVLNTRILRWRHNE